MTIKKILIANRGEIAVRVINACTELGIVSAAVYSEADKFSYHTERADEAYCIGKAPASESYLDGKKIIDTALKSKCDAIHPGYGFLSENANFASQVKKAGLVFIGPPAKSIEAMGDKPVARQIMMDEGVPVVPGTTKPVAKVEDALDAAKTIGYPVLIKAAGGGGGKGMRKVESEKELKESFNRAVSEAESAFGNPVVYLEKYITSPRHIEFQVLADEKGNVIHLGERECSVQRRHQKVVEEAPSSILTEEERSKFGAIAVQAAKACEYTNAGTVEFLLDGDRNFYFLEMNTRLQVEHPVTEQVTHIDLVNEQIRIASGEKLRYKQNDIAMNGHAVECRIYAEDPLNGFYPSIGSITELKEPAGNGIRVDSGVKNDCEISIYYDPLIAKLVSTAENRKGAIARMIEALDDYVISGVKTNLSFCYFVMKNERFQKGDFDTNFVENEFKPELLNVLSGEEKAFAAAAAAHYKHHSLKNNIISAGNVQQNNWKRTGLLDAMK